MAPKKQRGSEAARKAPPTSATASGVKKPRFYSSRAVALREIRKHEELLRKALDQLEKVRGEWETVKNDLEAERAMSSILRTLFELVNEHISAIVEITFMDGYRAGFECCMMIHKEIHPEIDVSSFEVHDYPMPPELLKDLEDLKESSRLSWSSFC